MFYYELKNIATWELAQVYANNIKEAAAKANWKVKDIKCIYKVPTLDKEIKL